MPEFEPAWNEYNFPCSTCGAAPGERCATTRRRWSRDGGFSTPGGNTAPHTPRVILANEEWKRLHPLPDHDNT